VRSELDMVSNVALQLIAQEATRQDPIVVTGLGPRIVVYTVHGDLAVEPDSDDLGRIPGLIDSSDWEASLPASAEDEPWARVALARKSARVTVRATE
jgi:hypothetical protein